MKNKDLGQHKLLNLFLASLLILLVVYWEVQRAEFKQIEAAPVLFTQESNNISKESTNWGAGPLSGTRLPSALWDYRLVDLKMGSDPQIVDSIELKKFYGNQIIIHFWASWCEPCIKEFPEFLDFAERARQISSTTRFLTVSLDKDVGVRKFLKQQGWIKLGVEYLLDSDQSVSNLLGIQKFPETLVVDRDGMVVRHFIGAQNWKSKEMLDIAVLIK